MIFLSIFLCLLCLGLIVLVTLQPRQTQLFSNDVTSNIGKPSYFSSQPILKILTLLVSLLIFLTLFILMILSYN